MIPQSFRFMQSLNNSQKESKSMIPEIFAVGTGLLNFFEKSQAAREAEKRRSSMISALNESRIDMNEKETRLDNLGDAYNSAIVNDLNAGAVKNAISGLLNPTTFSALIPEKANALATEESRINQFNDNVAMRIAEVQGTEIPTSSPLDLIEGGIEGYGIGTRLQTTIDLNDRENKKNKAVLDWLKNFGDNSNINPFTF